MTSTRDAIGHPNRAGTALVILTFSAVVSSQLHWFFRHGFAFERSWRLAVALLPALAVYGLARTETGRAACRRLPEFWNRWLSQSWVLLPGAFADPLFPLVTILAWVLAVLMDRPAVWTPLRCRIAALPAATVTTGLMALALALMVLRAPALFTEARLWAEDGRWFEYAYHHGFWESLTFVREYLIFYSNLVGTLSANLLPVEWAAAAAVYAASLAPLAALFIIATADTRLLDTPGKKLVAMALLLLIPPSSETWLVVISVQYTLVLIAALILIEERPPASPARRWFYRLLLGMGGLTGVLVCLLTPMYAYKWYRTREREFAVQAGILAAACLIQFCSMTFFNVEQRSFAVPPWTTVSLVALNRHILEPINMHWAVWLWTSVSEQVESVPLALAAVAVVGGLYGWAWRQLRDQWLARLVLLTALGLLLFSITFAFIHGAWWTLIEPNGVPRYFYAPNAMFALCLFGALQLWRRRGGAARSVTAAFVLAVLIASGALDYFAMNEKPIRVYEPEWAKWSVQVAKWREDPYRRMRIWPRRWSIVLKPQDGPDRP